MTTRGSDKASRYIDQLNAARLSGSWADVKEFARKVAKHAPNQSRLVLVANTEADFPAGTSAIRTKGNDDKLSSAAAGLRQFIGPSKDEKGSADIALDARATLACVLVYLAKWHEVLEVASKQQWQTSLIGASATTNPLDALALLKCIYALGTAQLQTGAAAEADETFQGGMQYSSRSAKLISQHQELDRWASRIYTQSSLTSSVHSDEAPNIQELNRDLIKYRAWSQRSRFTATDTSYAQSAGSIWKAYHSLVSNILRSNIAYTGPAEYPLEICRSNLTRRRLSVGRGKQFTELQRVERAYEHYLASTTAFPAAHESSSSYEAFVDAVLANWQIIMTAEWSDADVGHGGKHAYSRSILEILYRASAKTFHSTPVLRHLFTVHAQLGEFDLAIKAFDSYTDIVGKSKARAEKTGEDEVGLDSDDLVLQTAGEAVNLLCLYGERTEAEKAYEVGELISSWLQQRRPRSSSSASQSAKPATANDLDAAGSLPSPLSRAAAYRAIGQGQATWARYAYESMTRKSLQQDAIKNLRHSQALSAPSGADTRTAYMLAYSLAESRQPSAAIGVIKTALASQDVLSPARVVPNADEEAFDDIRIRFPLWNLLVLVLSAMSEYDAALSTCEAALEMLVSKARRCDGEDETTNHAVLPMRLTESLTDAEKESFLQLKLTEIELLVLTENLAYGSSRHQGLMITYQQLFGNPGDVAKPRSEKSTSPTLSKARPGTVKSFRQSMFGRPKLSRKSLDNMTFEKPPPLPAEGLEKINNASARQLSVNPPSVTVTDTDGVHAEDQAANGTALSIRRGRDNGTTNGGGTTDEMLDEKRALESSAPLANDVDQNTNLPMADGAAPAVDLVNLVTAEQPPTLDEKAVVDVEPVLRTIPASSLPTRIPPPILPLLSRTRHHLTLLIKIWLSLSAHFLPVNASEALAATSEAQRLLSILQSSVAPLSQGAKAWLLRGWGLGSSIATLQADILAQRGAVALQLQGPHAAAADWEKALLWAPDHPVALPGLAHVLLDMHAGAVSLDPPKATAALAPVAEALPPPLAPADDQAALTRLGCRDRAYMLCSTATKGPLWDCAQAWFLLGRAWEVVGHADKAAECYWWVVELEDSRPVRGWECAGLVA